MRLDFSDVNRKFNGLKVDSYVDVDGDLCIYINGKLAVWLSPTGKLSVNEVPTDDEQFAEALSLQIILEAFK